MKNSLRQLRIILLTLALHGPALAMTSIMEPAEAVPPTAHGEISVTAPGLDKKLVDLVTDNEIVYVMTNARIRDYFSTDQIELPKHSRENGFASYILTGEEVQLFREGKSAAAFSFARNTMLKSCTERKCETTTELGELAFVLRNHVIRRYFSISKETHQRLLLLSRTLVGYQRSPNSCHIEVRFLQLSGKITSVTGNCEIK